MTVADRWEGQAAGTCGCGAALIWSQQDGEWQVTHLDATKALYCSSQKTASDSDVSASA